MRRAGFRVLGFGIESFSRNVLEEFNKGQIHRHIEPMLTAALELGHHAVPRSDPELAALVAAGRRRNLARSLSLAAAGLRDRHVSLRHSVLGRRASRAILRCCRTRSTHAGISRARSIEWDQPAKILPIDPLVREVILQHRTRLRSRVERSCNSARRTCLRACARSCGFWPPCRSWPSTA